MSDSRQSELSGMVRKAHAILGVMWPRPGVQSLANARFFVPNKVFESFRSGLKRASELVSTQDGLALRDCLLTCKETAEWLASNHERLPEVVSVDPLVNLLYLATGIASNKLNDLGYSLPSWAESDSVRPLEELLEVCRWTGGTGGGDELLERVRQAMEREAQNLSAATAS
jgi:hypothetical protein